MGVATLSVRLQFGRASRAPHAVRIAIIENLAKALELALLVGVVVFSFGWSPIRAEGNAPPVRHGGILDVLASFSISPT